MANDSQMEEDLRAAIAISPEFAPPYGVLAVYLSNRGENLPEALQLAQKAQTLSQETRPISSIWRRCWRE